MTKKKLKRWEWIKPLGIPASTDSHYPWRIRRAFRRIKRFYLKQGWAIIGLPFRLEDKPLISGKRYRWIIEELDELPDGLVTPKAK